MFELSESVLAFTLKREQELSIRNLFNCIDLMAVLPTEFGKNLISRCGVQHLKKNQEQAARVSS